MTPDATEPTAQGAKPAFGSCAEIQAMSGRRFSRLTLTIVMTTWRLTVNSDRDAQLTENIQWRACVEQVVLSLSRTKDPQADSITVWLMRWLSEPKNVRRTMNMTINDIVDLAKSMLI